MDHPPTTLPALINAGHLLHPVGVVSPELAELPSAGLELFEWFFVGDEVFVA